MTDAALVKASSSEPDLSGVSVLIIDEAHERSLNTDLVLGIAKLVRQKCVSPPANSKIGCIRSGHGQGCEGRVDKVWRGWGRESDASDAGCPQAAR